MISRNHPNRKAHNWLAYDIGDRFLEKYAPLYRGILYDFGAGASPYREFFLRFADKYVAVDWTGSYHDTKADVVADLNRPLPIESESVDTVVALSVLEHLREPQTAIREAHRILRRGGMVLVQVPWQWWVHEAPYDFFRYTPYALKYLFEQAGFINVKIEAQAGFFTTMTLKWNYFTRRFIRGPKPLRGLARAFLGVFWYTGQKLAPYLDKLDDNWALETAGFYLTAEKK